ncbi:type II restriction endonuclease [Sphingopyxis sp.]|uniref:type II restriction endonuclease n=1 Tax=Sphingopyxis sp. TaxID=1908224 RepID=UPI003D0B9780
MERGHLSEYFSGIAVKRLSAVETRPATSNQHEFNASTELKKLLGEDDLKDIATKFIWIGHEQEAVEAEGFVTWYDARRKHPTRSEYRLYYSTNDVTAMMDEGDAFFLAKRKAEGCLVIITPSDSTMYNQLLWLFGVDVQSEFQFSYQSVGGNSDAALDFVARFILEALDIDPEEPEGSDLDRLIAPFGLLMPKARMLSDLARSSLALPFIQDAPDLALMKWMEREDQLFRRLERKIVAERLRTGFQNSDGEDVEGFIAFSLSVQNRRKSRAGLALESHIEALLIAFGINHSRGAVTENGNKPDFLFPGATQYADPTFDVNRLTMLGAKSTLKERWRQVLSEAERIQVKHLLTFEPGISLKQTAEMQAKQLQLVLPRDLHATYKPEQQAWLMDVSDFIRLVQSRQS